MAGKLLLAALLVFTTGAGVWASEDESVLVTIRGTLHEDKFGYFVRANGGIFNLTFADNAKADMHKFYSNLNGDHVQVSGSMYVDEANGKHHMTVYTNDITHFKGQVVVTERREVVEPPIIVREGYYEHRRNGIDLPGVHIHW